MIGPAAIFWGCMLVGLPLLFAALGARHGHGLRGLVSGMGVVLAMALVRVLLAEAAWRWQPPLPRCRAGKCRPRDFKFAGRTEAGEEYRCSCGGRYLLDRERGRLQEIAEGGPKPFMRHSRLGRWRPDGPV